MARHDRLRFFAFGLLPLFNASALLLHGLDISTSGRGSEHSIPWLIVTVALCLLVSLLAAVRRGHDLGWSGWLTGAAYVIGAGTGLAAVVLIGVLAFARGRPEPNAYGPPPPPAGVTTAFWALFHLALPWMLLTVASRLL